MVPCPLCPLVISASPAWWSSRHALACQLKMGPQSTLKVPPSPQASPFLLSLLSSSFTLFLSLSPSPLSSYQSPANTPSRISALFSLSNSLRGMHLAVFPFSSSRPDRGGMCHGHDPFNRVICDIEEILFGPDTLGSCIKGRIQMWIN